MSIVYSIIAFASLAAVLAFIEGCATSYSHTEPRPYIVRVGETGRWAIAIDADNRQPIFRQFGYVSDQAALDDYIGKRPHIAQGWRPIVELNPETGKYLWKWNSWISEQEFDSPAAAVHNIEACRAAILDHADPLMVYDLTL